MDELKREIDRQIHSNRGKNLFHESAMFSMEFIKSGAGLSTRLAGLTDEQLTILADYATQKSLEEFCRINQYYTFDPKATDELKGIYIQLFSAIKQQGGPGTASPEAHYENLRQWLLKTNPFAGVIYPDMDQELEPAHCHEYSAGLQLEILRLGISNLVEPILDIGCGKQGNLVQYLRSQELEAYGIDRFAGGAPYLYQSGWFEYDYGTLHWGTVISHLGFSNHFVHHHLRNDGDYLKYAAIYMKILASLRPGGRFYYAPSLPFIEQWLDKTRFNVISHNDNLAQYGSSTIEKLSHEAIIKQ